jgi:hypothetical protein
MKVSEPDGRSLKGRTIAVTGGNGFIGTHVVQKLCKDRANVCILDIVPPKVENNLSRWLPVDVQDQSKLVDAIQEITPTDVISTLQRVLTPMVGRCRTIGLTSSGPGTWWRRCRRSPSVPESSTFRVSTSWNQGDCRSMTQTIGRIQFMDRARSRANGSYAV